MTNKKIVLTGGGTAGHVMPNLALTPSLLAAGYEVHYVGSKDIEASLVRQAGLPFYQISSGKLRRYVSVENFVDIFRVVLGVFQAIFVLLKIRPQVVFSKGGFVAVPVSVAARILRIPVVSHESDFTPGLANRIIAKFARKLLYTFPETAKYIPAGKGVCVPTPIRKELYEGNRARGLALCGFNGSLPIVLVMGGSQGAQKLNDALLAILPKLNEEFCVVHLTGKGKAIAYRHQNYCAFEFMGDDLKHLFAMTDVVVCRAGANSIFEMVALNIPMLLVPLEVGSRGDQILNADSFKSRGWADVIRESTMTPESLLGAIKDLFRSRDAMKKAQQTAAVKKDGREIIDILASVVSSP